MLGAVAVLWAGGGRRAAPRSSARSPRSSAIWGGNAFLNWQRAKRTEKFIGQLPELSRMLANATSAGLALRTALAMAAEEMDAPAGDELALVANQLAVGRSLDDALDELAERLPSRELVVLVTTLVLSNRAGGTIVGSLRNLTATLEERKETRREVRTMLAEVNATAFTVPLLGLGAMLMMNSHDRPARSPGSPARPVGQIAMVVALGLYAVGLLRHPPLRPDRCLRRETGMLALLLGLRRRPRASSASSPASGMYRAETTLPRDLAARPGGRLHPHHARSARPSTGSACASRRSCCG